MNTHKTIGIVLNFFTLIFFGYSLFCFSFVHAQEEKNKILDNSINLQGYHEGVDGHWGSKGDIILNEESNIKNNNKK